MLSAKELRSRAMLLLQSRTNSLYFSTKLWQVYVHDAFDMHQQPDSSCTGIALMCYVRVPNKTCLPWVLSASIGFCQLIHAHQSTHSIALPHCPSPQCTSHHLASPHLTSPHPTSPHLTSPHLTPPQVSNSTTGRLISLDVA